MIHSALEFLPEFSTVFLIKLCIALSIMIATRMTIVAISPWIQDICKKNNLDHHSCHLLNKAIRYLFTIVGATIALQNLGIEVSMLIAAFGITGFLISYGMKDIVANFIASILIMGYKHIKINDYIKIKDWEGKVIDINLRYTTLQKDDATIFVPNIILYTQTVSIINKN
jgi:small-conductance mechanosensitive channel